MLSIGVKECFFFLFSTTMIYRMLRELLASRPARDPVEGVGQARRQKRGVVCYREHRSTSCRFLLCCCLMLVYRV